MILNTQLFDREGKENLHATISAVALAASDIGVTKIIVFAASAQSAITLQQLTESKRNIFVVTFPAEFTAKVGDNVEFVGIPSDEERRELAAASIGLLQGVMPFRALGDLEIAPIRGLRVALSLLGGGAELCVQAVLMACDAGFVRDGERCIVMSADTALLVRAGHAYRFFEAASKFVIEHVICKPVVYSISRPDSEGFEKPLTHEAELVRRALKAFTPGLTTGVQPDSPETTDDMT